MTTATFSPPYSKPDQLPNDLQSNGYAVIAPSGVCELAHCERGALEALTPAWDDLPLDGYLKDGGHYRRRRHSCFVVDGAGVTQTPHRAHWQPL
ncbi:MAG TPA: 2OG-Fe dioxygenase family protein, partial [Candidatus Manganitrophaceae bacterium]|nr:2OG-Fe dioxygenase family protein [Candidatus Manganitrophaceae bacterium]